MAPAFRTLLLDNKSEEYLAELKAKASDPTQEIGDPFKPMEGAGTSDKSEPHLAMTIFNLTALLPEDLAYYSEITHPIHINIASQDDTVDNEEAKRVYAAVSTPSEKKQIVSYDSHHRILGDGWVIKELVESQLNWLDQMV